MQNQINTFIFDCFGVICTPVINGWYKSYVEKYGLVDAHLADFLKEVDMGKKTEQDVVDYFLHYQGVDMTPEELRKDIDNHLSLDLKLASFIRALKEKGFKTVLLSNANHKFFERKVYTTYPQFKDLFDEIIISSTIGMVKPDWDIYLYTLNKINKKPEETIFIDDSKKNVDAALDLGMNGFVYTTPEVFIKHIDDMGVRIDS